MIEKQLPCPFCGAEAWGPILCDDDWSSWYCVECSECGVRTPRGLDEKEAIAVWNHRVGTLCKYCKYGMFQECNGKPQDGLCNIIGNHKSENNNKPLSFSELKSLEQGTPIWIEWTSDDYIEEENDWDGDYYLVIYCLETINKFVFSNKMGERQEFKCDMYEISWKAYRRKND